ncbi:hypothetical protein C8F04DRAFT_1088018 [Mycena alexandri]|uniref:Velvet domain-containing protein n=1 Tax=Mycena alexandri TaxID=1745969 RepID=A0AAD6T397_9AGAR|nr:hypothetical protein C8F04DRAFT_1088018 [Mycena alexandri]
MDGQLEDPPHAATMPAGYAGDRSRLQYELTVRQEPKQARMCGIGGKADRRPIDPPVIVQLRVIDPAAPAASTSPAGPSSKDPPPPDDDPDSDAERDLPSYAQSFLQNPYYFMFASLAKPDDDTELHWLKDGRTRCTTGSVVSSLYALKDPGAAVSPANLSANPVSGPNAPQGGKDGTKDGGPTTAPPPSDAGFFVFPDLSVRTEGSYRLKLSLFEVVGCVCVCVVFFPVFPFFLSFLNPYLGFGREVEFWRGLPSCFACHCIPTASGLPGGNLHCISATV